VEVVLFGNPSTGTPLMVSDPRVGIDLPLRMLVWEDGVSEALVGYRDPRELASRYDLTRHRATLDRMAELLAGIVAAPVPQPRPARAEQDRVRAHRVARAQRDVRTDERGRMYLIRHSGYRRTCTGALGLRPALTDGVMNNPHRCPLTRTIVLVQGTNRTE
jgi:Domain of unknown function DUF302